MFRIEVNGECYVGPDRLESNAVHTSARGLPLIEAISKEIQGPLAVVGGGPSVVEHLEELRRWPGKIWAINGTCAWLASHGIESILFSVDPGEELAPLAVGVRRAILASHCDPTVFDELKAADVLTFHSEHVKGAKAPMIGGSTSATRVPKVALMLGHREIHYFGCEGSFDGTTHAYKDEQHENQVIIRAGGKDYRTTLQMMVQSENLAKLARELPHMFKDRSGGLFAAMIEHWDTWEVVALSDALRDKLDPTATERYPLAQAS